MRLKIGDPFVFGRGGEEVLKFREHGVEPKVIPVSFSFFASRISAYYQSVLTLILTTL